MKTFTFKSQISYGNKLPDFTQEQIKNEPMLWRCTPKYAYEYGGPIVREFLNNISKENLIFIDTRSHMLMEGFN